MVRLLHEAAQRQVKLSIYKHYGKCITYGIYLVKSTIGQGGTCSCQTGQMDQGLQVSGGRGGGCGEVTSRGRSTTGKVIYLQTLWGGIMYGVYLVKSSIGLGGTGCCPIIVR